LSLESPLEDLKTRPIPRLIADPLLSDHRWLLQQIDRLVMLWNEAQNRRPNPGSVWEDLGSVLQKMRSGLIQHLDREEQVVFPAVLDGNADEVRGTIRDLELDHHSMQESLARVHELCEALGIPGDSGEEEKGFFTALTAFQARIERHALIEDQILFPRVFFEQPDSPKSSEDSR